jgi:hypothetical protein
MEPAKILIQLDTDRFPSVFDAVVAVDSHVDHLLQYSAVDEDHVVGLVHGAMFTRSPAQLRRTAIFVGGSNVAQGQSLVKKICSAFFGPIRVSVMLDSNGANTTAAAAVLCASRHIDLKQTRAMILGGTGPVGQRVARLLLDQGARVTLISRQREKARQACDQILEVVSGDSQNRLFALGSQETRLFSEELTLCDAVFSCGAAGVTLLDQPQLSLANKLKVAIDLNAVPPSGIAGISVTDKAAQRGQRVDYGAIGVGGLKMKIHRAAIDSLFENNDQVLDAPEIFAVGKLLEAQTVGKS